MIEISIPKDIRKVKTKVFGPFSLRESFFIVVGVAQIFVLIFLIGKIAPYIDERTRLLLSVFFSLPYILVGFITVYGMPFEKYAKIMLLHTSLPKNRKYKTENAFDIITPEERKEEMLRKQRLIKARKMQKKNKNKNPEYEAFR